MPKGPNRASFIHIPTARSPSINRRRPLPLTDTIRELTKLAGRRNTRKKYRKAKTKIRKSRKNIPKRGGGFTNEIRTYNEIMTHYKSIFPSLEPTLSTLRFFGFQGYLISIIDYLIENLTEQADANGYSNMSNEEQVESILKPTLDKVIDHQTGRVRDYITSHNITSNSILNAPTKVSQDVKSKIPKHQVTFDKTSKTYKTTRINVLLSKVDEYQLIPELITDLKVFKAGKDYTGDAISKYEFPKTNPPTQIQDKPTLTETEKQEGLIPKQQDESKPEQQDEQKPEKQEDESNTEQQDKLKPGSEEVPIPLEGEQPTKGGKKKSRARNKLYNAHKKMYSRRKNKT